MTQSAVERSMPKRGTLVSLTETFEKEKDNSYLIRLPYKTINKSIGGGLRRGFTSVISGPPGNAKSYFVLNTLVHAIEGGVSAVYLPLEYSAAEHMRRVMAVRIGSWGMVSTTADKAQARIDAFFTSPDMLAEYEKYEMHVCENPFNATVCDHSNSVTVNKVTFNDVLEIVIALSKDHKLIIIDPVTAISADTNKKETITDQQTSFVMSLNALAKKFDFHPMLVGHTGRRQKYQGKATSLTMDDMSGAIAFQRFAQYVFLLDYHDKKTSTPVTQFGAPDVEHTRTLLIDKTSFGNGNKTKIAMDFKKDAGPQLEDLGWIQ